MKYYNIFIIALTFFLSSICKGQTETTYHYKPNFYVDILNYKSEQAGKNKVNVMVQVPYKNLQFIKTKNTYFAEYTINITFFDEDQDKILHETTWNKKITVSKFSETSSQENFNLSVKNFSLPPGKYFFRGEVYDTGSKKKSVIEMPVNILSMDKEFTISSIIIVKEKVKTENGISIVPNVAGYIQNEIDSINFIYNIYADTSSNVVLEYSLLNKEDKNIGEIRENKYLQKGTNNINYTFVSPKLLLGEYTITVKIKDSTDVTISSLGKKIFSYITGFPPSISNLDEAIEEMVYIAKTDIVDEILEIENYEKRLKAFKDFWKSKDPSPNTVQNEILNEYYRRIDYANKYFGSYKDGWRSDMGMIYITLGPPDHVERHPFDSNSKPYQIWQYYDMNRRFVFIDESGFGDYRLLNTNFQDWDRYRY